MKTHRNTMPLKRSSAVMTHSTHTKPAGNRQRRPPISPSIPIMIEAAGATWNGYIQAYSPTQVTVNCQGRPPISPRQRVLLRWNMPAGCIEFEARIDSVHFELGVRMRATITFEFKDLDEFTRHRLKRAWQHPVGVRQIHLQAIVLPIDQAESLMDMLHGAQEGSPSSLPEFGSHTVCERPSQLHSLPRVTGACAQQNQTVSPSSSFSRTKPSIASREVVIRNRHGQRIVGFWDCAPALVGKEAPVAIVASAYGETKRDSLTLAYYLAANGLHVIRYDHTNHVGESDGDHLMTTLSRMHDDLQDVWGWVNQHFPAHPTVVIATSLAGRVALKASRTAECHPELLVLLNPVVDMRRTLQAVHREDLLGDYLRGKPRGITNVLGLNVDGRRWLADAHQQSYTDAATTMNDAKRLNSSVIVFSSEHDVWVSARDVSRLTRALSSRLRAWFMIPGGLHRLVENPRLARLVYAQVVQHCRAVLQGTSSPSLIQEPDQRQLGKQKRVERTRGQLGNLHADLDRFWNDYLAHFDFVINSHDYQQLLDHIVHLLNPLRTGGRMLDAGCGNGILAAFLLACSDWFAPTHSSAFSPVWYVGLDFVAPALSRAHERVKALVENSSDHATWNSVAHLFRASFLRANLGSPLPFPDHTFDAVVANLVLGYLPDQHHFIRECLRVLMPGGTLIVTNLKPNSDLSRIYCNFVEQTHSPEDIEEARHLLANAGKIREAEGDGVFQFHDKEDLRRLLQSASGGVSVQVFPTFANQAYLAILHKPHLAHSRGGSPSWEDAA